MNNLTNSSPQNHQAQPNYYQPQPNYYQPQPEDQVSEHFYKTKINGLYYFQAEKFNDERGFFSQVVILPELDKIFGQPFNIKQVNHARSKKNVVRGMHAEGWNKLITVISGKICSVLADIRPDSPTFKQIEYFELGYDHQEKYGNGLFIPQGLANSICVLEGPVSYLYLVDKLYQNRDEKDNLSVNIFDPELNINWPIKKEEMILSARDKQAVSLEEMLKAK